MMTLLSGHLQGQRGEDVLDINMLTGPPAPRIKPTHYQVSPQIDLSRF
jgi:hypothetical protein